MAYDKDTEQFDSPLGSELLGAFTELAGSSNSIDSTPSKTAQAVRGGAAAMGVAQQLVKELTSGRLPKNS